MRIDKWMKISYLPLVGLLQKSLFTPSFLYSVDTDTLKTTNSTTVLYANADVTSDESYRQLVAGNARYLKEDSNAARFLPRLTSANHRFPLATFVFSDDMPVNPNVLTQTSPHDLYLNSVEAGVVTTDNLQAIE